MSSNLSKPLSRGAGRWTLAAMSAALIFALSAQAAEKKKEIASDESAIRAAIESYVAAYNRGDAKAVAEHWRCPSGRRAKP